MKPIVCNSHANETPKGETIDYRPGQCGPAWTVECSCVATYRAIVGGEDIPKAEAYCALVREADKHADALTDYASDLLVHDRRWLDEYRGPFLWVLRELGTHIIMPSDGETRGAWNGASVVKAFGYDGPVRRGTTDGSKAHRFYWWDGAKLRALRDAQQGGEVLDVACARMAREASDARKGRAA